MKPDTEDKKKKNQWSRFKLKLNPWSLATWNIADWCGFQTLYQWNWLRYNWFLFIIHVKCAFLIVCLKIEAWFPGLYNQHPPAHNIIFLVLLISKLPELQWSDPQLSSFPFTAAALHVLWLWERENSTFKTSWNMEIFRKCGWAERAVQLELNRRGIEIRHELLEYFRWISGSVIWNFNLVGYRCGIFFIVSTLTFILSMFGNMHFLWKPPCLQTNQGTNKCSPKMKYLHT